MKVSVGNRGLNMIGGSILVDARVRLNIKAYKSVS